VLTCGEDRLCKVWDVRRASKGAVATLGGHTGWATCAKYNPFHDQLVASGGTDCAVNLWRASSVSSAPLLVDADADEAFAHDGGAESSGDVKIRAVRGEHDQAVAAVAWSRCDPWLLLSLSVDGRAIVAPVPSAEKYNILL
jgi:WD40 repeat protein